MIKRALLSSSALLCAVSAALAGQVQNPADTTGSSLVSGNFPVANGKQSLTDSGISAISGGVAIPTTVGSTNSLRAYHFTNATSVRTLGYYIAGDGGGATFNNGGCSSDDGGSCILSSGGNYWKNAATPNAKQFGMRGDGVVLLDAVVGAGSTNLNSVSATFTSNDCHSGGACTGPFDKYALVQGCLSGGAPLVTTLVNYVDSHDMTMAASCTYATPNSYAGLTTIATAQSGSGSYAPNDTLTAVGGTCTTEPTFTVSATKVLSVASIASQGSGGTPNATITVVGTTGGGTKFQASVTLNSGGGIQTVNSVTYAGIYITNPTNVANEPVTGGNVVGGALALNMGLLDVAVATRGLCASTPSNPVATTDSGSGTGGTLNINWKTTGTYDYATDDTAALANFVTYGEANGVSLAFPCGKYWLASKNTEIYAHDTTFEGCSEGGVGSGQYSGSQLWISNTTTPEFQIGQFFHWRSMSAFWPAQTGYSATPIVYPAFVESNCDPTTHNGSALNSDFHEYRFVNPYILWRNSCTTGSSGSGLINFDFGQEFCIYSCFFYAAGAADTTEIGRNNVYSVGVDPDANAFPQFLGRYAANSCEFMHADFGSATDAVLASFVNDSYLIHGCAYGARLLSGRTVIQSSVKYYDGVQHVLSVENSAGVQGNVEVPGWIYANNPYTNHTYTAPAPFNFPCTTTENQASQLNILNTNFIYAAADFIDEPSHCIWNLKVSNNYFQDWGENDTVPSTYYAINISYAGTHSEMISDNKFYQINASGIASTLRGIYFGYAAGDVHIVDNTSNGSTGKNIDAWLESGGLDSGNIVLDGNSTQNTATTSVLSDSTMSITPCGTNFFDILPSPAIPACAVSGFAGLNLLTNPAFDVWQALTSVAPNVNTNTFVADRWKVLASLSGNTNGHFTISRGTGFCGNNCSQYALQIQRGNGDTDTGTMAFGQQIYTVDTIPLQSQTIHLQGDLSTGANWSAGTLKLQLWTGTGTDETFSLASSASFTGAHACNFVVSMAIAPSTTEHFDTSPCAVPANATEAFIFGLTGNYSGTAGAADTISLTNLQLVTGSTDATFQKPLFRDEIDQAQYTYQKSFTYATAPAQNAGTSTGELQFTAQASSGVITFPIKPMRIAPTPTKYSPGDTSTNCWDETSSADQTCSVVNVTEKSITVSYSGATAGHTIGLHYQLDSRL